jgi:D-alanyl-D-alanine carboxypeptidase
VSTLSGYVKASSGKIYAFSILCNRAPAVWRVKRAQDGIVRAIIDHG